MQADEFTNSIPLSLAEYLRSEILGQAQVFRRRAVLVRSENETWVLMVCTIDTFPPPLPAPTRSKSIPFANTLLYEDWLTPRGCQDFVDAVHAGTITLGEVKVERFGSARWRLEHLSSLNTYMPRSGLCVSTQFEQFANSSPPRLLLAAGQPYFPSINEAIRFWLPLGEYHGEMDSRNRCVLFLLPQTRAYIISIALRSGALELGIAGTEVPSRTHFANGAFWLRGSMSHFETTFINGSARLEIPTDAERLDLALIDSDSVIYDFRRIDGKGLRKLIANNNSTREEIDRAQLRGEGMEIEFKPFTDLHEGQGGKGRKTKLGEILTTVVAFANARGGTIFIGIDDECRLVGIDYELAQWAKGDPTVEKDRYCGALLNKLREHLVGDVEIEIEHAIVDDRTVVLVRVAATQNKPIVVRGDSALYVRQGASNAQTSPTRWKEILEETSASLAG